MGRNDNPPIGEYKVVCEVVDGARLWMGFGCFCRMQLFGFKWGSVRLFFSVVMVTL
jgi:hypothetical protein